MPTEREAGVVVFSLGVEAGLDEAVESPLHTCRIPHAAGVLAITSNGP